MFVIDRETACHSKAQYYPVF